MNLISAEWENIPLYFTTLALIFFHPSRTYYISLSCTIYIKHWSKLIQNDENSNQECSLDMIL